VKQKDAEEVDRIVKEIGVVAAPYLDTRPFLTPTLKVIIIVIIILTILLLLIKQ
jgi:MFS-type transporter involved in bile tolerance (Atg22 family)